MSGLARRVGLDPGAIERADLGEQVEKGVLALAQADVVGSGARRELPVCRDQHLHCRGVQVVAEQVVGQARENSSGLVLGGHHRAGALYQPGEADSLPGRGARGLSAARGERMRKSGSPFSIWALGSTAIEATTPAIGAFTVVTIFIDSSTAIG